MKHSILIPFLFSFIMGFPAFCLSSLETFEEDFTSFTLSRSQGVREAEKHHNLGMRSIQDAREKEAKNTDLDTYMAWYDYLDAEQHLKIALNFYNKYDPESAGSVLCNLGFLLMRRAERDTHYMWSAHYLIKALALGEMDAAEGLACLYARGKGVYKSEEKAREYKSLLRS